MEFRGHEALERLALDMRKYGSKEIERRARAELRKVAVPLREAEKAAVRALPSRSSGRLRAEIAKATVIQVSMNTRWNGVTVWVNPKRMPASRRNLGAYMEGVSPFQRWRHPVYGRRSAAWAVQRAKPWFYRTARGSERRAEQAIDRVVDQIAKELGS
ncbi:hypothetical protein [Nonomuraea typhae]|uniref:hypothetical protein n=1 Tax=Nonomuraea typhae TaxID=2603600 RepID=UPI0012FBDCFF|nr:hypothetical protein [Nonomuraea typhae]